MHFFRGVGHRKAVSYVRYLNNDEVVSASTDSTLRLWNARSLSPTRVFSGHANEKNFVGLSVDSEFIACGSETNEVRGAESGTWHASRHTDQHLTEECGLSSCTEFLKACLTSPISFLGQSSVLEGACRQRESAEPIVLRVCRQVFVYYRALAKPIAKRVFSSPGAGGQASEGTQFISAVCWKPEAQTLLAANSQGCIKVMELTS